MRVSGHAARSASTSHSNVSATFAVLFRRPGFKRGRIILPLYPSDSFYINPDNIALEQFGDWNSQEAVLKAAQNVLRIAQRFLNGGHEVPISKIISRYYKSSALAAQALSIVDRAYVYDNSKNNELPQLIFRTTYVGNNFHQSLLVDSITFAGSNILLWAIFLSMVDCPYELMTIGSNSKAKKVFVESEPTTAQEQPMQTLPQPEPIVYTHEDYAKCVETLTKEHREEKDKRIKSVLDYTHRTMSRFLYPKFRNFIN